MSSCPSFRAVDFDYPAARQAADAQCNVEAKRASRHRVDLHLLAAAELHRRTLAERAVDLREGRFQCLLTIRVHTVPIQADDFELRCHGLYPFVNWVA